MSSLFDNFFDDAHVRRERERARELRKSRWWQNLIAQAKCYYCCESVARAQATMDHILPLSQGGRSTPGNIVVACKACNTRKRDMSAVEWELEMAKRAAEQGS